jgi:hypothetical protein
VEYLGIDWSYRRAVWCSLSDAGVIVGEGAVPADADDLARLVIDRGVDVRAVVEMMSGAIWVWLPATPIKGVNSVSHRCSASSPGSRMHGIVSLEIVGFYDQVARQPRPSLRS